MGVGPEMFFRSLTETFRAIGEFGLQLQGEVGWLELRVWLLSVSAIFRAVEVSGMR